MLWQREHALTLRDLDRAQLTSPRVKTPEDLAMHGLQVSGVVVAEDESPLELSNANGGEPALTLRKLSRVANTEVVSQNIGTGVDVWIIIRHRPTHIELVPPGALLRGHWPEQIGQRLAGRNAKRPDVELRVGDLLARPPIQQRLSDTGVKPLSTNRSQRVRRGPLAGNLRPDRSTAI
jgi:hypothetical protein